MLAKRHCGNKDAIHLLEGLKVDSFNTGADSSLEMVRASDSPAEPEGVKWRKQRER